MESWEVVPEREPLTSVGGGRMLLPVAVRNPAGVGTPVRLGVRVEAGADLPPASRWVLVPGERQTVPAAGQVRFLVLVDPPADVAVGRYELRLELFAGAPGSEASTGVTRTVPVLVGAEWAIQFVDSVPSSGLVGLTESTVTFEVRGPGGASVRIGVQPELERDDLGKFPSGFIVQRPELTLPVSGLDSVTVVVVLGTSEVMFHAVLVDAGTALVVANSEPVLPNFDHGDPNQPF